MRSGLSVIFIILFVSVGLLPTNANAAQAEIKDLSVIMEMSANEVTITGKHTGGKDRYVAVKVIREEAPSVSYYENDYKTTAEDGGFEFKYKMDENSDLAGSYLVQVKGTNTELVQQKYNFVSNGPNLAGALLADLNAVDVTNRDKLSVKLNNLVEKQLVFPDTNDQYRVKLNILSAQDFDKITNWILDEKPFANFENVESAVRNALDRLAEKPVVSGGGGGGSPSRTISTSIETPGAVVPPSEPIIPNKADFSDISNVEWAIESITFLAKKGIVKGTSESTFEPERSIKREEFVAILVNAFGLLDPSAEAAFSDVDKNEWYYKYVASAKQSGIINGISEQQFGIGGEMTRQDMVTMVYRAVKSAGINLAASENHTFTDEKVISDYAKEAVDQLSGVQVISGFEDGSFAPGVSCTRAMTAKVIYRILQIAGKAN